MFGKKKEEMKGNGFSQEEREIALKNIGQFAERFCLRPALAVTVGAISKDEVREFVHKKIDESLDKVLEFDKEELCRHLDADAKANFLQCLKIFGNASADGCIGVNVIKVDIDERDH